MALPESIIDDDTKNNAHGFCLPGGGGRFERFQAYAAMAGNHDPNRLSGKRGNPHAEKPLRNKYIGAIYSGK